MQTCGVFNQHTHIVLHVFLPFFFFPLKIALETLPRWTNQYFDQLWLIQLSSAFFWSYDLLRVHHFLKKRQRLLFCHLRRGRRFTLTDCTMHPLPKQTSLQPHYISFRHFLFLPLSVFSCSTNTLIDVLLYMCFTTSKFGSVLSLIFQWSYNEYSGSSLLHSDKGTPSVILNMIFFFKNKI